MPKRKKIPLWKQILNDFQQYEQQDEQQETERILRLEFLKLFKEDRPKKRKTKAKKKRPVKDFIRDLDDEITDDETLSINNTEGDDLGDYIAALFDNLGVSQQEQDQYNGTLAKALNRIKRQYKKVSPKKFFYNTKRDLNKKYKRIQMHLLVHSSISGYSILATNRGSKKSISVGQWANRFNHETKAYGISTYDAITQNLLPAIRNKSGDDWRFISLIGWNGYDDFSKDKHTNKRKGNKTAKKRDANARRKRRD